MTFDAHNWNLVGYCEKQVEAFRDQSETLSRIDHAYIGSLPEWLEDVLSEGIRALDRTDRNDAFWTDSNMLPTVRKLHRFCRVRLELNPVDEDAARWQLALCVHSWSGHLPAQPFWSLPASRATPKRWLVEGSWLEYATWGKKGGRMKPIARARGTLDAFQRDLETCASEDGQLREWVAHELSAMTR